MHPIPDDGPEQLTGPSTHYWSRIFPRLWSGLVGIVVLLVWLDLLGDAPAPDAVKWVALGIWGGFSTLFFKLFGGLRHVWLDGDNLIVGDDPRRGVRIHLREVRRVKESRIQQVKTITLELARPTPLGSTIRFIPRGMKTFLFPLTSSPVARELKERHERLLLPR